MVRNGESKVHVIESGPQVARFEASPDAVYRFEFDKPGSRQEAEAMMESFSAKIVAGNGTVVAVSEEWDGQSRLTANRTPVPVSDAEGVGRTQDGTALEQLKAIWQMLRTKRRKPFCVGHSNNLGPGLRARLFHYLISTAAYAPVTV